MVMYRSIKTPQNVKLLKLKFQRTYLASLVKVITILMECGFFFFLQPFPLYRRKYILFILFSKLVTIFFIVESIFFNIVFYTVFTLLFFLFPPPNLCFAFIIFVIAIHFWPKLLSVAFTFSVSSLSAMTSCLLLLYFLLN